MSEDGGANFGEMGMTLRDYFAAKAMSAWISTYGPDDRHPATCGDDRIEVVARQAYQLADAMIAERAK
jgi:hypothetical protein